MKDESESLIVEDVIDEEVATDKESIAEDSIVNEIESEPDTARNKKIKSSDSIAEDSIIRDEYSNDNYGVKNASDRVNALNRVKFGMHSSGAHALPPPKTEAEKQQ